MWKPKLPPRRKKKWERPSQIVTDTKYKASVHFLGARTSVPHGSPDASGFIQAVGRHIAQPHPDSRTASGTNGAVRSQISYLFFLFFVVEKNNL